jgi:hypothetical protein
MAQRRPSRPRLQRSAPARATSCSALVACAAVLAGCAGGAPLLHPAHTLAQGKVTAGAGVSGNFVVGEGVVKVNYPGAAPPPQQAGLEGWVLQSAFAPGVSPWVGARVGIGGGNEAGVTYHGRSLRVDARHAFGDEKWALSVGAGASAVLSRIEGTSAGIIGTPGGATVNDHAITSSGWGLDLPVLVGYRSTASVAQLWLGVRGGIERLNGEFAPLGSSQVGTGERYALDNSVMRYYGGGLLGAAIGFRPFWVAFELNVAYQYASGQTELPGEPGQPPVGTATLDMSGVTIAPSGAFIGKF